jgi:hypothetical protein
MLDLALVEDVLKSKEGCAVEADSHDGRVVELAEEIALLGGRPCIIMDLLEVPRHLATQAWRRVHDKPASAGARDTLSGPPDQVKPVVEWIERMMLGLYGNGFHPVQSLIDAYKRYEAFGLGDHYSFEAVASYFQPKVEKLRQDYKKHLASLRDESERAMRREIAQEIAELGGKPPLMREILYLSRHQTTKIWKNVHGAPSRTGRGKERLPRLTTKNRGHLTYFARVVWLLHVEQGLDRIRAFLDSFKMYLSRCESAEVKPLLSLEEAWLVLKSLVHGENKEESVILLKCRQCETYTLIMVTELAKCHCCRAPLSLIRSSKAKRENRLVA